MATLK